MFILKNLPASLVLSGFGRLLPAAWRLWSWREMFIVFVAHGWLGWLWNRR